MGEKIKARLGGERVSLLRQTVGWAAVLLGYFIFTQLTGVYIPCVFRELTGFKCPGCGVSHMLVKLSRLDFSGAFEENQLLFFMLPALCALLAVKIIFLPRWLCGSSRVFSAIMLSCIAAALIFAVVRNL